MYSDKIEDITKKFNYLVLSNQILSNDAEKFITALKNGTIIIQKVEQVLKLYNFNIKPKIIENKEIKKEDIKNNIDIKKEKEQIDLKFIKFSSLLIHYTLNNNDIILFENIMKNNFNINDNSIIKDMYKIKIELKDTDISSLIYKYYLDLGEEKINNIRNIIKKLSQDDKIDDIKFRDIRLSIRKIKKELEDAI